MTKLNKNTKISKRIMMFERFVNRDHDASRAFPKIVGAIEKLENRVAEFNHLHNNWLNVIRRIQSTGKSRNVVGCAIITINVVINDSGDPVIWSEPKCTLIEPMGNNTQLLDLLSKNL